MPSFEHNGARIYYEEYGQGFPLLTFAPAGLASVIKVWSEISAPINPTTEFAGDFRVIAMDQRNAGGQSRAPITALDSWDSYTQDHIALLDHLRIHRCHLYGQCIGRSSILNLIKEQLERVAAAVLAQPIGRVGPMPSGKTARFEAWAASLPRVTPRPPRRRARHIPPQPLRARICQLLSIATSCGPSPRRASCWPATTRPIPMRSRRNWTVAAEQRVHRRVEDRGGARCGARSS